MLTVNGNTAQVTSGIQALSTALDRISTAQTRLAKTENVDMADAITGMTQAETAYRAALGAAGATAKTSLTDYIR